MWLRAELRTRDRLGGRSLATLGRIVSQCPRTPLSRTGPRWMHCLLADFLPLYFTVGVDIPLRLIVD